MKLIFQNLFIVNFVFPVLNNYYTDSDSNYFNETAKLYIIACTQSIQNSAPKMSENFMYACERVR